jgi:hypothetical protein
VSENVIAQSLLVGKFHPTLASSTSAVLTVEDDLASLIVMGSDIATVFDESDCMFREYNKEESINE